MYADTRGEYLYFGILTTDDTPVIKCEYAASGSTSFVEFPFEGNYGYINNLSECPRWKPTVNVIRTHHANAIIKITWNNLVYLTTEAKALLQGAYIVEGTTNNNMDKFILI